MHDEKPGNRGDEQVEEITLVRKARGKGQAWSWDSYVFWWDNGSRLWRWALESWHDDGVGIQHHGGAEDLGGAVAAAKEHRDTYPR